MVELGIDLHMHTRCSDGCLSPAELMAECAGHGLQTVAITDHDAIDGLAEGEEAARRLGLELVPGVELTAAFPGELHILGLGIDSSSQSLADFLQIQREKRDVRNQKMVEKLQSLGMDITHEELVRSSGLEIYGRTQMAKLIAQKGYAASGDDAFQRWVGHDCSAYVKREKPSSSACIQAIHDAGGLAVWAHPVLTKLDLPGQDAQLLAMLAEGLDGIEAFYTYHDQNETEFCLKSAEKYGILPTCGSDFHGGGVHKEATLDTWKQFHLPDSALERLRGLAIHRGD